MSEPTDSDRATRVKPDFMALAVDALRTAEKGGVGWNRLKSDVAANLMAAYELGRIEAVACFDCVPRISALPDHPERKS